MDGDARKGQVYIKVLAARGLVGKDSGGTNDVYCQIYLDKEKVFKSEILKKTIDPVFEHEKGKIFNLHESTQEVRVVLKDDNLILPDAFLGQISWPVSKLHDGIPHFEWIPVESRPNKKDKVQGEVHVQIMYSERPDGNITLEDFTTPIQVLLKKQKIQQFRNLMEKGAGEHIEAKDKDGNHPLHVACALDLPECVTLLIKKGADVKAKNERGFTALHSAAEKSTNSLDALIEAKSDLEAKDKDGSRPLHIAAAANNGKALTILLDRGANINAQDEKGNTPLHVALQAAALEGVKVLASSKKVDIYKRNKNDQHAAHLAMKIGGDLKRIFMDAVHVEDDREFEVVDSGFQKRHRFEGENVAPDFMKSTQFLITAAKDTEAKVLCHYIGSGSAEAVAAAAKVGFCLVTTPEGRHAEMSYQTNCVGYGGTEPLPFTFKAGTQYAVLPYSQDQEAKGKFSLLVFTRAADEVNIKLLASWKTTVSKAGEWKGESAGGCNKENHPWRKNPHFILRLPKDKKDVEVYIMLEQQKSTLDIIPYQVHPYAFHIGFYIYDKEVEDILDRSVWQNAREVYKHFKFDTTQAHNHELIIVPTTVKPGQETSFKLSVFSDSPVELDKFTPPKIVDVTAS